ncbi:MAG TPA: protease pro-enzyme activation domain-containing protein [Terriglobales bacterium]|nr:protease pro-enzyme activation domain-containing protein [Terriglobales bacterium]
MIRRVSVLLLTVAVIFSVTVVAQTNALLTRHTRDAVVNGEAKLIGRMPASQTMRFSIVLPLRHAPELLNFLDDIYDPSSANYRHFLTPEEFTARFGPSQEEFDQAVQFAKAGGFKVIFATREGRNIQLQGTANAVEKAFHVNMNIYQHPTENRRFFAPDREPQANLPFPLWHVSGLDNYALPRPLVQHKEAREQPQVVQGSCPGNSYCGSDMRAAYYGATALTGTGQNIALLELAGTTLSDLTLYYKNAKQTEPYTPTLVSTGGYGTSCTGGCDDAEQTLDMTQAMGMAPGSTMLYNFVCGDAYNSGTFDETACLSAMVSTSKAPLSLQISSSWSWLPADPGTDDPYYQQMAAQGQSFFDAAGDSGAWASGGFAYPGDDVWVICVGGTDLQTNGAGGSWKSETGWPDGGGGINFDNIAIPSYQQLSGVINSQNKGSKTLRNGPDLAAEANFDFYVCHKGGCGTGWGGTSFAAPMYAGYMALANQQAVLNGAAAPGFINPAIYPLGLGSGYAAAFHDITSGNNGFPAVAGYDLITGWGSPNGTGLIDALTQGGGGGPVMSLSPTSLKWGKIAVGTTASGKKKVTATNTGTASLTISNIAVTGDFALVTVKQTKKVTPCSNGLSLAPGASCLIKVSFTPTQTGTRTGAVNFTDNAPGSPQSVALSGTGK